ncbi:hypothetical protein H0H93_004683 [Arthromyces matolae]|nr:hypothetical protein H0H93_004683 [Arthromyces matolae]
MHGTLSIIAGLAVFQILKAGFVFLGKAGSGSSHVSPTVKFSKANVGCIEQELRRVQFNVEELMRVACVAIGAETCLSIKKISESDYIKVFRLRFDNSMSLMASLPHSNMFGSGVSPIIASEVATMTLMRKWELNTPQVLSWSKDQENSIGWPYILMEDVGDPLGDEWREPEMRGKPVDTLLTNVKNQMAVMSATPFSRLGSIYFPEDIPEVSQPSGIVSELEHEVRVGPIANFLWWRGYHDEPHLDRGPWDTVEQYIKAAVRLERRAVERHRADPTSLIYTKSSVKDLLEIEHLLDKVDSLAPHVQAVVESVSPSGRFMRNCLMHPHLNSHNIIVPKLTAENSVTRMKNPYLIDWQGTCALPFALQWDIPPIAEYQPELFQPNGEPVFPVENYSFGEVPWPDSDYTDNLSPEQLENLSAEHRIATRNVRWNQWLLDVPEHCWVTDFHTRVYIRMMIHYVLRACAEGPYGLRFFLIHIKKDWDSKFREKLGPCPYTFTVDELEQAEEADVQYMRFETALTKLSVQLGTTRDGGIDAEYYDTAMKGLAQAKLDWDEKFCDWEGTCVLPFALQWDVPQIAEYQPDMFEPNGEPVFPVKNYSVGEVPWPDYTNTLSPEQLEILSAEHRIATRTVDWNQSLLDVPEHYAVTDFHTRVYIRMMIHYVLRACAEGPYGLRFFLIHIKKDWDSKFREKIGPCPYTFTVDELERAKEADVQYMRFENMLTNLAGRLQSTKDGEINAEHYDTARKELARARLDWDEKYFGKPFPFQDGQYSELLR